MVQYINYILFLICYLIKCIHSLYIPCVTFNQNCYNQSCCEPYVCYEQTVCIGMNETKN